MKFVLKCLAAFVVALILGVGSAAFAIRGIALNASVKNGAWHTNLAVGSKDADMYTRAAVAVVGLFALNKSEVIYYTAFNDDEGQPLRSSCDYRLEGKDIDARWWAITAYGDDHFLIPNEQNRYSYNVMNVAREADLSYKIYLSNTPKEGDWLPLSNKGNFSVSIRLYNPAQNVYDNPATVELPRIIREGCR